ncbi:TetR/AcrR family transcriptional regulator [Streptosporangium sp. KLBMP 9127]|nr:TetR/AcrR family transcriptional regulator [Streptosporangium sp. KLBMP 9127]
MTRAAAKARTRELLLASAAQVFAEQGYAGGSVDEIAARAGYTIGALYSHFSGKDELFLTLFDDRVAGHLRAIEEIVEHCGVDDDAAFAAFGDYLTTVADSRSGWSGLESEFLRYALTRAELLAKVTERRESARDAIARLISRRAPSWADAQITATAIIALFEGLLMQRRVNPASVPPVVFAGALRRLLAQATS